MNRWLMSCVVAGFLFTAAPAILADNDLLQPTGSATTAPATQPSLPLNAKVSVPARKVLSDITAAYSKISAVEMAGSIHFEDDMDGKAEQYTDKFHGWFQSPNKFVNETTGNMISGSTGQKAYAYSVEDSVYVQKDAPATRDGDWPGVVWDVVMRQNPSLAMLLATDPATQLVDTAKAVCPPPPDAAPTDPKTVQTIELLKPTKLGDQDYLTLQLSNRDGTFTFLIDAKSHLLRQITADQRKYFENLGHQQVKNATLVFDYTTVAQPAKVDDKQFAWTPPVGARELTVSASAATEQLAPAVAALIGKPAPDFHLVGIDGKQVTLSEQKGHAVVVDFWATWCPACVEGLPILDKVYQSHKNAGLKVFAVSVDEDAAQVPTFLKTNPMSLTVLLDDDQHKTSTSYGVEGIPETVVIGRDGLVKQVLIGVSPDEEDELNKLITDASK